MNSSQMIFVVVAAVIGSFVPDIVRFLLERKPSCEADLAPGPDEQESGDEVSLELAIHAFRVLSKFLASQKVENQSTYLGKVRNYLSQRAVAFIEESP